MGSVRSEIAIVIVVETVVDFFNPFLIKSTVTQGIALLCSFKALVIAPLLRRPFGNRLPLILAHIYAMCRALMTLVVLRDAVSSLDSFAFCYAIATR